MNKLIRPVIFLFLLLAGSMASAQVSDAGLWMSVNIDKKVTQALSFSLTQEVRMNENITEVGNILTDLGASYRFGKHFRVGAGYRYSRQRRVDDSYDTRHRFNIDLIWREKIQRTLLSLRFRYESQFTDMYTSPEGLTPKSMIMPRLEVKYNLPGKFEPFVYGEPYFKINNLVYGPFVQMRLCGGVAYSFNRMHSVDLYYLYQKEYNVKHPQTDYVIGIGYNLTF